MGLDIRLPIGLMFALLGPILVITGIINHTSLNTLTGLSMSAFGFLMLFLSRKTAPHIHSTAHKHDATKTASATQPQRRKMAA